MVDLTFMISNGSLSLPYGFGMWRVHLLDLRHVFLTHENIHHCCFPFHIAVFTSVFGMN